jgi:two-component system, chemotaxis family, sensor kinase Cph1
MLTPQLQAMLAECANEPIRYPGKIQPHGALLVVERKDLTVVCASENTAQYLGVEVSALIGQDLRSTLELSPELLLCVNGLTDHRSGLYTLPGTDLVVRVHVSEATALLELQPRPLPDPAALPHAAAAGLSAIHMAPDAATAIELAIREVQRLVGYDRVMAYCFDKQWNGQVVAERTAHGATSFLGLRYPASDIPEQARALYAQHWLRIIPDVSYSPVALRALDASSLASLDLGDAVLRSVSPVHIEYLKSMGVSASLSISVRCEGSLWGLIACHHGQPRYASFDLLERCELVGCVLSAKLETEQASERARERSGSMRTVAALIARMRTGADLAASLARAEADMLGLVRASGAVILHRGARHVLGEAPDSTQLQGLLAWLAASGTQELASAALHEQYPSARDFAARAAGLLCVSLPDTQPAFLAWFRPEQVRVVNWGGNPEKPIQLAGDGLRLGPRRSFELWKETVHLTSQPWTDAEREAAAELRRGIIEAELHRQLLREQEHRHALEQSNRELDAYAHVIAHDLQAPVRGIVAFTARMQRDLAQGAFERASERAQTVGRAADALAELVRALHQYSRAGQVELAIEDSDLTAIVQLEIERLAPLLTELNAEVQVVGTLPVTRCDRVRVGMVLGNLISNAVKYNLSPTKQVRIFSDAKVPPTIYVADNGIGIAASDREHVLRSFKRLHGRDAFGGGSGMGLSIAQKIVERHGGRLWIEDTPGGGTTVAFTLAPSQTN